MDSDLGEMKVGGGRGRILLQMLKKQADEEKAAAQASGDVISERRSPPFVPQSSYPFAEGSSSPQIASSPPKIESSPQSHSSTASSGRAKLLALLKQAQSVRQPGEQAPIIASSPKVQESPPGTIKPASACSALRRLRSPHPVSQSPESVSSVSQRPEPVTPVSQRPEPVTPVSQHSQSVASVSSRDTSGVLGRLSEISISCESSATHIGPKPQTKQGVSGERVRLVANYIDLQRDPNKGLFMYEVKFNPDIDSRPLRRKLLHQHSEAIGRTRIFDGALLYLPQETRITTLESTHPIDGSIVKLTLIFKREQTVSENIPFFNVLLGRVMRALSLIRIGQHNFNPAAIRTVPKHKLEVWPGYVTAITEYEGGLKLCIDSRHRVMRTETVRDLILSHMTKPNFKTAVEGIIQSTTVITRYNNTTYRIDDIDWNRNPMTTFKKGDTEMSLVDYYKTHWNLTVQDKKQPLLVHRAKKRTPTGEVQEVVILLIPELCYVAGITDDIRSDFNIMKDLDNVTKADPRERRNIIRHFVQEIQKCEVAREILEAWGLKLSNDLTEFGGRILDPETIYFGNNRQFKLRPNRPADWSKEACNQPMLRTPHLNSWFILFSHRDSRCAEEFCKMFRNVSQSMGMNVAAPRPIALKDDRIETYVRELQRNIANNMNLAVIIFPTNRTDRYTAVKRICCVEMPIPSQVIMSRTISRADKLKSVTEKIALQINCKLGGALWSLAVPMDNFMICGIDVYHGPTGKSAKGSVAGFVASLDKALTTWHSRVCLQGRNQELIDLLQGCFVSAIKAYYKRNTRYPDRIIIYRDGVGDGQLETVAKYEVKQLLATLHNIVPNYKPKLSVIVVQKRINTRLFCKDQTGLNNPLPGVIADSVIVKSNMYDFFLVSQNIRRGTVSPTRYIVIYDSAEMKAEHIQRLTYKMCHLYYNSAATIKVPAPCNYAHKLVYLVGQTFCLEPHSSLSETLFYL